MLLKWLALVLLLLNVGFWLYQSQTVAPIPVNPPASQGASRLILMQELNFSERDALKIGAESAAAAGAAPETVSARPDLPADPYNLIRQPDALLAAEQQRLSLLRGLCHLIEVDPASLRVIAERFETLDVQHWISRRITETPGPMMVYVPPYATAREAAVEVSVLRAEGVDSFIIPDGELANGISVGVFGSQTNAMTRSAQLGALGYPTEIYQYTIEEAEEVLNVDAPSADVLGDSFWVQLEADFPSMVRQQNSCIEVASQDNFQ